MELKKEQD